MTRILTYHPKYEHKSRLQAILENYGTPELSVHPDGTQYVPSKSEQLADRGKKKGATPSRPLLDYVDIMPSDILENFLRAEMAVGDMIDEIASDLSDKVTIGPQVDDYIRSKEQGEGNDPDLSYEFEDLHSGSIEGSTKAEVLPVLLDLKDELEALAPFVEEHIGPIEAIRGKEVEEESGEYINPGLEEIRREEESAIERLVELDQEGRLDLGEINEKNHVNTFLDSRFESIYNTVVEFDNIFNESLLDRYAGATGKIVEMVNRNPGLKQHFKKTNERRFGLHAHNAADAHLRMKRLITKSYKRRLLDEVMKKQEEKLQARAYVDTLEHMNPESESDPFNLFIMETLVTINEVGNECDQLVEDLYRITELERIQTDDYTESLARKNEIRQFHGMLENIDSLSLDEGNVESEILKLLP